MKKFVAAFMHLTPLPNKDARSAAWRQCDYTSNGHVSLAEADGWVQNVLKDKYGDQEGEGLWRLFRPSYIRAFYDAKDVGEHEIIIAGELHPDDYVQRREFRLLCAYLCV